MNSTQHPAFLCNLLLTLCLYLNEQIHIMGFDLTTHTWQELAPMHSYRCYVSVTAMDGYIYAMGGFDGYSRLNSVERYQPSTNQWTLIASMHQQRSDASCTTLHHKVGGSSGF
uniref:Uncharacterized protein n=1 Tax=Oreochromis aureus TaxID=47969 RepID=A0AAZ1XHW6_OREAU